VEVRPPQCYLGFFIDFCIANEPVMHWGAMPTALRGMRKAGASMATPSNGHGTQWFIFSAEINTKRTSILLMHSNERGSNCAQTASTGRPTIVVPARSLTIYSQFGSLRVSATSEITE
jgi:hypothetical protein